MPHNHSSHRKAMRMNQQFQKVPFNSCINDVVIKDIKGEGYEGTKTLLNANDILEKEKKTGNGKKCELNYIVGSNV